jgi:hypothetical protein
MDLLLFLFVSGKRRGRSFGGADMFGAISAILIMQDALGADRIKQEETANAGCGAPEDALRFARVIVERSGNRRAGKTPGKRRRRGPAGG